MGGQRYQVSTLAVVLLGDKNECEIKVSIHNIVLGHVCAGEKKGGGREGSDFYVHFRVCKRNASGRKMREAFNAQHQYGHCLSVVTYFAVVLI